MEELSCLFVLSPIFGPFLVKDWIIAFYIILTINSGTIKSRLTYIFHEKQIIKGNQCI